MVQKNSILLILFVLIGVFSNVIAQTTDKDLGFYYYNNEDFEKAVIYLEKVFETDNSKPVYLYYTKSLLAVEDYKEVEKVAAKQVKRNNRDVFYKVNYGAILKKIGKNDKANKYYENLISDLKGEKGYGVYSQLGYEFTKVNELDLALEVYNLGNKSIATTRLDFGLNIADIYGRKGQVDQMIEAYLQILDKNATKINQVQARIPRVIDFTEDNKKSDQLRVALLKRIQGNPNKTVFNQMLVWYYQQTGNFRGAFIQVKALDKRKNTKGGEVYNFAKLCMSNKQYDLAVDGYSYILENFTSESYYYASAQQAILQALKSKIKSSPSFTADDVSKLEARYAGTLKGIQSARQRVPILLEFADFEIYYGNKLDTATILLDEVLNSPGVSKVDVAKAKTAKGDVLLIQNNVWEASLLYMQVEKAFKQDVIGQIAKFKNAKLYYYTGDYEWCQNQLDALKASTSKLISNDAMDLSLLITDNYNMDTTLTHMNRFSQADLLMLQNKYNEAIAKLDSIQKEAPEHSLADEILYKRYEISFKKKDYASAEGYLNQIVEKFPEDILADNALFQLGDLYENQLPNQDKAIQVYEKLLFDYPGSLFVVEARKRYRSYKGGDAPVKKIEKE